MSGRTLDMRTLEGAAKHWATEFSRPSRFSKSNPKIAIGGEEYVLQSMFNATYKDEHGTLFALMMDELGKTPRAKFEAAAKQRFTPRENKVFESLLAEKLAIRPDGEPIKGKIGSVIIGQVPVAGRVNREGRVRIVHADVHVGETPEQAVERYLADLYNNPHKADFFPLNKAASLSAANPTFSYEIVAAMLDAGMDVFDEGTSNAVISIYDDTAAQPTDPDVAISTQVLLARHAMSDPAFGAAADQNPNARATADTISDDTSIDATGTANMYRVSATNDGSTPIDDHADGNIATSDANMIVPTTSYVAGATSVISSFYIELPQY